MVFLDVYFQTQIKKKKINYIRGGSVAQSTPGATAFASSYLGPNKYTKYVFYTTKKK